MPVAKNSIQEAKIQTDVLHIFRMNEAVLNRQADALQIFFNVHLNTRKRRGIFHPITIFLEVYLVPDSTSKFFLRLVQRIV